MDIKKLGLASTIAVLSVTVALSGCDLFSPDQEEIEHLNKLIELKDQTIGNRDNSIKYWREEVGNRNKIIELKNQNIEARKNDIKSLNETVESKNKVITEVKERYNSLMAERNAIVNVTAKVKAEADERQERLKYDAEVARIKLEEAHKRSAEVGHQRLVEEKKYKEKIKRIIDNSVPMSKYNDLIRDRAEEERIKTIVKKREKEEWAKSVALVKAHCEAKQKRNQEEIVRRQKEAERKEVEAKAKAEEEQEEEPKSTGYRFPERYEHYKEPPRGKIALAYAYDNDGNIHEVEQVIPE